MRANNLSNTMLRIGQRLLVSRPEFSILIQRNAKWLYLLDHDRFFKRYRLLDEKLPVSSAAKIDDPRRRDHGLEERETNRSRQPTFP